MSTAIDPPRAMTVEFGARTPWTAGAAVAFVLITVLIASAVAVMAGTIYFKLGHRLARGSDVAADHVTLANTMLAMLVMQVVMTAMVWWGAGRFNGHRQELLSLSGGLPLRTLLIGLAGMALLLVPYNLVIYLLWPESFAHDLRPFADLARSPMVWLGGVVVAIGAPLSEELTFRGFLLPALAKARHGFTGAALITTVGWTALHIGYSMTGLIEVFLIGLYFCWLMWRFSNLWLTIALHALYNGMQLAFLAAFPPGPAL